MSTRFVKILVVTEIILICNSLGAAQLPEVEDSSSSLSCASKKPKGCWIIPPPNNDSLVLSEVQKSIVSITDQNEATLFIGETAVIGVAINVQLSEIVEDTEPVVYVDDCQDTINCELIVHPGIKERICTFPNVSKSDGGKKIQFYAFSPDYLFNVCYNSRPITLIVKGPPALLVNVTYKIDYCLGIVLLTTNTSFENITHINLSITLHPSCLADDAGLLGTAQPYTYEDYFTPNQTTVAISLNSYCLAPNSITVYVTPVNPAGDGLSSNFTIDLPDYMIINYTIGNISMAVCPQLGVHAIIDIIQNQQNTCPFARSTISVSSSCLANKERSYIIHGDTKTIRYSVNDPRQDCSIDITDNYTGHTWHFNTGQQTQPTSNYHGIYRIDDDKLYVMGITQCVSEQNQLTILIVIIRNHTDNNVINNTSYSFNNNSDMGPLTLPQGTYVLLIYTIEGYKESNPLYEDIFNITTVPMVSASSVVTHIVVSPSPSLHNDDDDDKDSDTKVKNAVADYIPVFIIIAVVVLFATVIILTVAVFIGHRRKQQQDHYNTTSGGQGEGNNRYTQTRPGRDPNSHVDNEEERPHDPNAINSGDDVQYSEPIPLDNNLEVQGPVSSDTSNGQVKGLSTSLTIDVPTQAKKAFSIPESEVCGSDNPCDLSSHTESPLPDENIKSIPLNQLKQPSLCQPFEETSRTDIGQQKMQCTQIGSKIKRPANLKLKKGSLLMVPDDNNQDYLTGLTGEPIDSTNQEGQIVTTPTPTSSLTFTLNEKGEVVTPLANPPSYQSPSTITSDTSKRSDDPLLSD